MRLVKLPLPNGGFLFVNPEAVAGIVPHVSIPDRCIVTLVGLPSHSDGIVIAERAVDVARVLADRIDNDEREQS